LDIQDILGHFQLAFFIELETAYNGGFVLDFELEAFFMRWQQLLETMPLTDKERIILTALCTMSFSPNPNLQPDEEKDDCAICYETYRFSDAIIRAPGCEHSFHEGCLMAWYDKSLTCPLCKSKTRQELIRKVRQLNSRQEELADFEQQTHN
jgi:Ring finger domain